MQTTRMEMELCISKYDLRDLLKANQKRYRSLFVDLYIYLRTNLCIVKVSEGYAIGVLTDVLDADGMLLEFVRKQKPLPSSDDTRIIAHSFAWLMWTEFSTNGVIKSG